MGVGEGIKRWRRIKDTIIRRSDYPTNNFQAQFTFPLGKSGKESESNKGSGSEFSTNKYRF